MCTYEKLKKNGLNLKPIDVERICKKYKILELYIFGSAIKETFHEESDVDILVSIKKKSGISLFDLVDCQQEFAELLKREVQIVEKEGLINPIRRENILNTCELIYVAS